MRNNQLLCHCGSPIDFEQCCDRYIEQSKQPKTAEQLMRSRFTAFKLKKYQYLIDTHQVEPPNDLSSFDSKVKWLGLKIVATDLGSTSDNSGTVEFVAFYQTSNDIDNNIIEQLHEKSRFKKVNNRWMYINGEPLSDIKLSRNEPCFCNSGKKFKKCHMV